MAKEPQQKCVCMHACMHKHSVGAEWQVENQQVSSCHLLDSDMSAWTKCNTKSKCMTGKYSQLNSHCTSTPEV